MKTDSTAPRDRGWPMQVLVALLVLAVTLPLGGLLFWNESRKARDHEAAVTDRLLQLAQRTAAQADAYLEDTLQLVRRLASRPAVRAMDPAACDPVFSEFPSHFPHFANLVLVDANGGGVCASANTGLVPGPGAYAHLPSIRAIAGGADHDIEPPLLGNDTKRWTSTASVVVRDEAGQRRGSLSIAIDLTKLPLPLLETEAWRDGASVEIVDRNGTRVAGGQAPGTLGVKVVDPLLIALHDGLRTMRWTAEGEAEVVAAAPVRAAPWFAVAHLPLESVVAPARERLVRGIAIATLAIVLVWIAAAFLIRRMLAPLREIADVSTAVAAGDTRARVRVRGPFETASIGAAFNQMLDHRAEASSALRAGEARYRSLFETSSDAIIGLGLDDRILFANPAVERLTGWPANALVGESLSVLQPPAFREAHAKAIRRHASDPGATLHMRSTETRCLHRDGHEFPVEVTFSAAEFDGAKAFVGFMRDITARHEALAGLRESEQRFRVMADSSPVLIWTADAVVREFYFNATWLAFTGQTLEEARQGGWYGGVHPVDAAALQEVIDRANSRHEGCTLEYRRARHDGEYRWVLDNSAPRFDGDGRFVGYVGTAVDIHDRVIAESRIRRLTTLYNALSQANEAIARSTDLSALLQVVCEIVVRQTGITTAMVSLLDESGSRLDNVAYSGEFASVFSRTPVEVVAAGEGPEAPGSLVVRTNRRHVSADRHGDESVRPIAPMDARAALRASAVYPLRRQGRAVGVLAVYAREPGFFDSEMIDLLDLLANDLSYALDAFAARERRDLAEDALKKLNATLEERVAERTRSLEAANRELEAFSYSVSHDLRAPLRGISGFSQLLHEGYAEQLDDTGRNHLGRVRAASARMARLIDDLLDLSRIARQSIRRGDVDVSALSTEVVAELREADPTREVCVSIAPHLKAHADPGLTRIVLANLLDNAWKFTSRTQGARVEVVSGAIDGRPGFTIRDNGAGFDSSDADRLFAPFQRLHGEREFPGTGIGLAIVQRIVHRHGGELRVTAAAGEGAAFTFTLG